MIRIKLKTTWTRQKQVGIVQFSGTSTAREGARPSVARARNRKTLSEILDIWHAGADGFIFTEKIYFDLSFRGREGRLKGGGGRISPPPILQLARGSNAAQEQTRKEKRINQSWNFFYSWMIFNRFWLIVIDDWFERRSWSYQYETQNPVTKKERNISSLLKNTCL